MGVPAIGLIACRAERTIAGRPMAERSARSASTSAPGCEASTGGSFTLRGLPPHSAGHGRGQARLAEPAINTD